MLNINKQTIIHIIVESVIIISITVYFNKKNNKLEKKIEEIFKKYEIQEDLIKKNDEIIKSLTEHIQILYKKNQYYENKIQSQYEKPQNNEIKIQSQNNEKPQNNEKIQNEIKINYEIKIPEIKIQKPKFNIQKMEIEEIEEIESELLDKEIESELLELNN